MKTPLAITEKIFATTLLEAESIVKQAKEEYGSSIKQHIIAKRQKKDVEYYIVTITVEHCKAADLIITE